MSQTLEMPRRTAGPQPMTAPHATPHGAPYAPYDAPLSRRAIIAGRVVSGLGVAFMAMDATMKLLQLPAAVDGTTQLGYPANVILPIGIVQVICLAVYLVPRTAVLGAILWTGYLGGAIATHVRIGSPLFTHVLFPIYVAALLWGGLWLRDRRARALISPAQRH